jgi:hypothetical protein
MKIAATGVLYINGGSVASEYELGRVKVAMPQIVHGSFSIPPQLIGFPNLFVYGGYADGQCSGESINMLHYSGVGSGPGGALPPSNSGGNPHP